MRRGLSDVLSTEVLLFVWDQCVLTSFDLVIPYAAACVLALLDEPLQFFLRDNDDLQVHEALMRLGKDLQLTDVETFFRRVVPKIAPDARELTDAISARPPPGLLVEASLPGAAALGGLADVVVDSLADGAGFTMHGILSVSRFYVDSVDGDELYRHRDDSPARRSHATNAQARSTASCGTWTVDWSGARSSRPKTHCRTSSTGY